MKIYISFLLTISVLITARGQDVFEVNFIVDFTQYRAALVLFDNGTGKMRVRYYDESTKMVEQSVRIENTSIGFRIAGYNPVYPGTRTKHPAYIPDNFYISIAEYGNLSITNIYSGGRAKAQIRKIEGVYTINEFLSDFNWQL